MFASKKTKRLKLDNKLHQEVQYESDSEDILPSQIESQSLNVLRRERSQKRKLLTERSQRLLKNQDDKNISNVFTQSRFNNGISTKNTYFDAALQSAGLKEFDGLYTISCDIFTFRAKLEEELTSKHPESIRSFIETFSNRLNDNLMSDQLLSNFSMNFPGLDALPTLNNSLAKSLLSIEVLQQDIAALLLSKLSYFGITENPDDYIKFNLILRQFDNFFYYKNGDFMFEELLNTIAKVSPKAKEDLIKSLEYLVEDNRQTHAVEKILSFIEAPQDLLTKKNLETFQNLFLEEGALNCLRTKCLNYMSSNAPKSLIPDIVKFLIYSSLKDITNLEEVINKLRKTLNWNLDLPIIVEIFDNISRFISLSNSMRNLWFTTISKITNEEDYTPIDILMLLLIAATYEDYVKMVETLIKKKVKARLLKIPMLYGTFKLFGNVITNYLSASLEIFENLLRDRSLIVSEYGSECFKLLVQHSDKVSDKHIVISKLISIVCSKTVESPFNTIDLRTNTLILLNEIKKKSSNDTRNAFEYGITRVLEYAKDLTNYQYRLAITILCSLAYDPPGDEAQQDHLEMLVRKQITNSLNIEKKKQGVITCARMISHILWEEHIVNNDVTDSEVTCDSISNIPSGQASDFARLITLTHECIDHNTVLLTLFYDEMADAISDKSKPNMCLNAPLLFWLSDSIILKFQENFIVCRVPEKMNDFEMQYFFGINFPEENESVEEVLSVAINIGNCLTNESFAVIFAHFSLVQAISRRRYNNSLEPINALVGCPLVLPKIFNDVSSFMSINFKACKDVYFYTINWFREIISGFVVFEEPLIRQKVMCRLSQLVNLEHQFKQIIQAADKKTKKVRVETQVPPNQGNVTTRNLNLATKFIGLRGGTKAVTFRQLKPECMLLLNEEFSIKYPVPESEYGKKLYLSELKFLVEDLTSKMESISGTNKSKANQKLQNMFDPLEFVKMLVNNLKSLMKYLQVLIEYLQKHEDNMELEQEHSEEEKIALAKACIEGIIHLLSALFSWSFFHSLEENTQLLKTACEILAIDQNNSDDHQQNALCSALKLEKYVYSLRGAVHLFNLVKALCGNQNHATELAKKFLSRKFYAHNGMLEAGANCNAYLSELLKGSTKNMELKEIYDTISTYFNEVRNLRSKDFMITFANFNRANQHLIFNSFAQALVTTMEQKSMEITPTLESIELWQFCFNTLKKLREIAETIDLHRNWSIFLAQSHKLIKLFLKAGIAVVERGLKDPYVNESTKLLKTLQQSTRCLNNLCNQSKVNKISQITSQIPELRKTIETLIYKIKSAYTKNNLIHDNIWSFGILKNKDLYGEEILSQITTQQTEEVQVSHEHESEMGPEVLACILDSRPSDRFGD